MADGPLTVAVLLNSASVREWQRRALAALLHSDSVDARVETVLVNDADAAGSSSLGDHFSEFSLWKVLRAVHLVTQQVTGQPWHEQRTDIAELDWFADAETIRCHPQSATGLGNTLPDGAVEKLGAADVAVRFGFGIVKGDALTAPTHGMLSYHHGDLRKYRGRPAGFHEFVRGEKTAGVTVQTLTESLDGGDIAAFAEVPIHDATSWHEVLSRLYDASEGLLTTAVKNAVSGDLIRDPPQGTLYTLPSSRETLLYLREKLKRPYDLPGSA